MERRKEIAKLLRKPRSGNHSHKRWGVVGLRLNGSPMKTGEFYPVAVLTVPAKLSPKIADAYERNQKYTCQVQGNGTIIFTPVDHG